MTAARPALDRLRVGVERSSHRVIRGMKFRKLPTDDIIVDVNNSCEIGDCGFEFSLACL